MDPCPAARVLEEFAAGACGDGAVRLHIQGCPECRAAVEEVRENNEFLEGVRAALTTPHENDASTEAGAERTHPDMVSGYQIQEELHRGGQGMVYRAVQTRTGRTVAIKMLLGGHRATGRQRDRFEREIRIAAALRHPNIVAVYDNGYISGGRYGLVMEYIDGVPLDRWSRGLDAGCEREARRDALRTRLEVMVKVCDAVLCAHQHSVVHRDLKPANILVDAAFEPHILDFGIARDIGPEQGPRLTNTGEFAGTPAYASPEQVSGDLSRIDTRTDIYSLGVIMYELVSGRMPYPVDGPMSEVLRGIESAEPLPLPRHSRDPDGPWVDGEVATIVLKAMAKDPARRYQTAADLRNDIGRYLAGEAIDARRDSTWYVLRKAAARHRVIVAAVGVIFSLLAVFGAAMTWQTQQLKARGHELARALSASNVERGRSLAAAGNIPLAEDLVFPELIASGASQIDGAQAGFAGTPEALHAYWALWDVFRESKCVATLRTGRGAQETPPVLFPTTDWPMVRLLYFDQEGQRLNALDGRGQLRSWSATTWEGVRERTLFAPVEGVNLRMALSPMGNIAVVGAGMIRIIDPETGRIEAQVADPDDEALTVTYSPDGTRLATTGRGGRLRIRDSRSPATVVMTADDPDEYSSNLPLSKAVFSPDGGLIAMTRPDASIGLWNVKSGALERSLRPPASLIEKYKYSTRVQFGKLAFAPDGAMASWFGVNLVVWPADGGAPRDLGEPGGMIANVAFQPGPEGWRVLSSGSTPGGGGGVTTIWDLATGVRVATFLHPDDSIALATSPDGRFVAAGMSNGVVQVYEVVPEPHVTPLQPGRAWPFPKMAISPDGRCLALTTQEGSESEHDVFLIDLKTRATLKLMHQTGPEIGALVFARDGLSLFAYDQSGRVKQWDLGSGSCVREFAFPEPFAAAEPRPAVSMGGTNQMRLSPDGRILALARDDGIIGLWEAPSAAWLGLLDSGSDTHACAVIDFSADGRTLAAQHGESLVLWDVLTRRPRRTFATEGFPSGVRWSPADPVIARSTSGHIQFLNTDTGKVLGETSPKTTGMAEAFHSGGTVFFASAWDVSIRLWDIRTGGELLALRKHSQFIRELVVTPDGNTLISSDWAGTILVWDLTYYHDRIRRELNYRASHPSER